MRDFDKWAASLVIVGEEAFLPDELDSLAIPVADRPVQTCRSCARRYLRGSYGAHADEFHVPIRQCRFCARSYKRGAYPAHTDQYHNNGRQRYFRERNRRQRAAA